MGVSQLDTPSSSPLTVSIVRKKIIKMEGFVDYVCVWEEDKIRFHKSAMSTIIRRDGGGEKRVICQNPLLFSSKSCVNRKDFSSKGSFHDIVIFEF